MCEAVWVGMSATMENSESEYGTSLVLHSGSNGDIIFDNTPTTFTNVLKNPIKLSQENQYEVGLANIHIPSYQKILEKNDFERSFIQYNLGLFTHNKVTGKWNLIKGSNRKLWKIVPDKTFDGLDDRYLDVDSEKYSYIKLFSESLKLASHTPIEAKCLDLFLKTLSRNSGKILRTKDLVKKYSPLGEGSIEFKILPPSLSQSDTHKFFEKMLGILSLGIMNYLKSAAYEFGENDRKHIDKIFQEIIFQKLSIPNFKLSLDDVYYNDTFNDLFIRLWEPQKKRQTNEYRDNSTNTPPILALYLTFGDRMCKFLSLDQEPHFLGYCLYPLIDPLASNRVAIPRFERMGIDSLFVYSDLVQHSVRLGDSITNLLGIVSVNKKYANMATPLHIFRPLSHTYFHSISVKIRDQNGEDISFEKNSYTALEIVIRKR